MLGELRLINVLVASCPHESCTIVAVGAAGDHPPLESPSDFYNQLQGIQLCAGNAIIKDHDICVGPADKNPASFCGIAGAQYLKRMILKRYSKLLVPKSIAIN